MRLDRTSLGAMLLSSTLCMCGCPSRQSDQPKQVDVASDVKKKVDITAKCMDNNGVTSADFGPSRVGTTSVGIINTHHFGHGDVVELIPPSSGQTLGTGSNIDTVHYSTDDFKPDDPPATTSQIIATDWDLTASADIPSTVTADIKAALKNNTQLKITGGSRHGFAHTLPLITSDTSIRGHILQHPERAYAVVDGIVNATDLSLQYGKQDSGSANVSVVKFGKISATINYSCSNVADIVSTGQTKAGVAFFYTTVGAVNGKVDTIATADLSKYSLQNARKRHR